ncbi:glutamate-1-semialdehyde 2,1-aminomutase 2, chloroplastic [Fagus crenata]
MAGAVAGVGVGLGLSCSTTTTKLSQRRSSSSKTTRRCCVKMAVSLDEKKKNYALQKSEEAFAAAKDLMPGGMNSPVCAFKSVGGQPIIMDSVKGSRRWDIDGNEYINYVGSCLLGDLRLLVMQMMSKFVHKAGAVAGVGVGLGLSCSTTTTTTKLSQRRSSSSKTTRRCFVKMAVSLDEKKKKNYTLQKSEEAFAAAKGSCMWDIDGNEYDYVGSWGPAIIGHADDEVLVALAETMKKGTSFGAPCLLENVLAEMVISAVPSIEMV